MQVQHPVPPIIRGPVFLSAADLYGFEFGSRALNPYQGFVGLEPAAHIQDGVLMYEGEFQVPLASALSFAQESGARLKAKDFAGAIAAARHSVAIDPDGFDPLMALGDALTAAGQNENAKAVYERAFSIVRTMEPESQAVWGPIVQKKMAGL